MSIAAHAADIDLPRLRMALLILSGLLPLLLGWKFIGYWMLGSGRYDTAYRACMVIGGIAGVAAAATVGGAAGAIGLAWTAIGVELLVIAVYYYVDGMSHDEIAGIIGCSRRTVGNRLEALHTAAAAA